MTLEEAREYFGKDTYAMVTNGIEILEVGDFYAKTCMKIDARHLNATGHIMGGAIYTLADFTFAVSTNTPEAVTVTADSQISFMASPKTDVLYAESKLLKNGKRTCFLEVEVKDDKGSLVAKLSATGIHL